VSNCLLLTDWALVILMSTIFALIIQRSPTDIYRINRIK
ncbi:Tetratricopeptide repeat family protein, partial [Giardia duodenalis]